MRKLKILNLLPLPHDLATAGLCFGRTETERETEETISCGGPPPQRPTRRRMRSMGEERTDPSDDATVRKGASVPNQTCACGIDHPVMLEVQIVQKVMPGGKTGKADSSCPAFPLKDAS